MSDLLKNQRRMLVYLTVSNLLLYFGFRVWQAMFNNFAVEEIGIGPGSIGWVQALREIPGLLGFLLGFLALVLSEVRIMALSVILLGAGIERLEEVLQLGVPRVRAVGGDILLEYEIPSP